MKVRIRNPDRQVEVAGPKRVHDLLAELEIVAGELSEEVLAGEVYGARSR